jgi:predicted RNA-binding protein YlxR (DUF448 family)
MANARPAAKATKRNKGPRPKHVPQRTCVACREQLAKRSLIRIVRTTEGTVELDPTGKKNGRGAYLHDRRSCWERGLGKGTLARALNVEISPAARETLNNYASSLPDESESEVAAVGGEQTHERE